MRYVTSDKCRRTNRTAGALLIFAIGLALLFSGSSYAQNAYITNDQAGTVSVIDTATNAVTATISVGGAPVGVAVTPNGAAVYVTHLLSPTLSVIDAATNTVTDTITIGVVPYGVAVTPDGAELYVTSLGANTVSVIGTATNTVTTTIPVGIEPVGVAVTPDGTKVYVADFGANTISVIDTASNTVTATIPVGSNAYGVVVTPDGAEVYVSNNGSSSVSVIDTATNTVTATIPVGSGPIGVAVTPDGTAVYVTNSSANTVSTIDTATNTVTTTIPVGGTPQGVAVTPDGAAVYVANSLTNTVSAIDTATNTVTATIPAGETPVAFGVFIQPATGNGVDLSRAAGDVADTSWQQMAKAGKRFAVVQAWGGLTQSPCAEDQLVGDGVGPSRCGPPVGTHGAQNNGLVTAAYALLNYLSNGGTGAYQVGQAIAAVGLGVDNLKFMVVDVEPCCGWVAWKPSTKYALGAKITDPASHIQKVITAGTSGTTVPAWNDSGGTTTDGSVVWQDTGVTVIGKAARLQRISDAVTEIQAKGLDAVIYTDRGSWKTVTGNCGTGETNNCSSLIALPLWDVEHTTFIASDGLRHCGDGIPGLLPFTPYSPSGWQARSGNQYDFGLAPSSADESEISASLMGEEPQSKTAACQGDALFGITVDLDYFDPSLFQ